MRIFEPDGSCDIQDLTFSELRKVYHAFKLPSTGTATQLRNRLYNYELLHQIQLKIFLLQSRIESRKY